MKSESPLRRPRSVYIEYLEKRIAPATFVVTTLNDSGDGSLRDAVDKANAASGTDTIVFKGAATSGEISLATGEIDITDSVNIKGPGATKLIIDARNLSRIFNIDDGTAATKSVTISGLSMVDGNSGIGNSGGGIRSLESLKLVNSIISGCQATGSQGYGGGLYARTHGSVTIRNSKIVGNTAAGGAGGLGVFTYRGIQIINTTVSDNTAGRLGGGIYARIFPTATGDILISGSTIANNLAARGGGIEADNDRLLGANNVGKTTIRNTLISGNSATAVATDLSGEGGGLYCADSSVLLERCTIINNVATMRGGGVASAGAQSLVIKDCKIVSNYTTAAGGTGGGVHITGVGNDAIIQSTLISSNASSGDGGGVFSLDNRLTVQKSTISGNSAGGEEGQGGGIYAKQGTLNVTRSTFSNNHAAHYGGGIKTRGVGIETTDVRITNSLFTLNRAANGGGVDTLGDGSVVIIGSRFVQNAATVRDGGGLYLRSNIGVISITSCLIAQNTARDDGGGLALYFLGAGETTITRTVIVDNVAARDDGGGVIIFPQSGTVTFKASKVTGNVAGSQGGGIYTGGATVALNGSQVTDNVAPDGSQVFGPFTP